jgi:hypothetical protein
MCPPLKTIALLCACVLACGVLLAQGKRPLLFAVLKQDTPVELADGAKWLMDKGDAFPLLQFKEQQTKLVLQLAGTSFIVAAKDARIIEGAEITPDILAIYRRNVASYIDGKSKKWEAAAKGTPAE